MAHLPVPEVRLAGAPRGDRENHRPAGRVQGVPHKLVVVARLLSGVVHAAKVVLDVVDAPRRIVECIHLLVAPGTRARLALARGVAGTGVDAELEAQRVDVVTQSLHAARELVLEGEDVPRDIVAGSLPAIVQVDIVVAGVAQAGVHHGPRHLSDELLVDLASKHVPRVPAHCRRLTHTCRTRHVGGPNGETDDDGATARGEVCAPLSRLVEDERHSKLVASRSRIVEARRHTTREGWPACRRGGGPLFAGAAPRAGRWQQDNNNWCVGKKKNGGGNLDIFEFFLHFQEDTPTPPKPRHTFDGARRALSASA